MEVATHPEASAYVAAADAPALPAKPKRIVAPDDALTSEKVAFRERMKEAREPPGMDQAGAAAAMGYAQQVQLYLMESGPRMTAAANSTKARSRQWHTTRAS